MNKVEILSPVGNMEAFYAALAGGCDAVYLAGKMFGARAFSNNFTNEELEFVIKHAHLYGVKVYVTCNILIFEREVEKFIDYIRFLHKNNVDAVIMQDIGMIDLVHKKFPNLEIHASTQLHIHNLDGAIWAQKMGIKRIVIARETPIEKIQEIIEKTKLEVEVFVHGALCVSYSGMCLMSRSIGNRSGNRGTCSGCCRLPYDILDKNKTKLNNNNYPLSMKDLMTISELDKLIEIGITSFKIEGRMKSKEYVYTTTRLYKNACSNYVLNKKIILNQLDINKLNTIFTRGYTKGFVLGESSLTNDVSPNHKGILIGEVIECKNNIISIKLNHNVSIHDGLRIINNNLEYGLILNQFKINNKLSHIGKKDDIITLKVNKEIPIKSLVYKTYSFEIEQEINNIIKEKKRKIPIKFKINILKNKEISLYVTDYKHEITLESIKPDDAKNKEINALEIKEKLEKINNTIYKIEDIEINLDNNLFVPISIINNLKRNILLKLDELRINSFEKEFKESNYKIKVPNFEIKKGYTLLTNNKKYLNNQYDYVYSEILDKTIKKLPKVILNYNDYNNNDQEYLVSEIGALNKLNNIITDYSFNVTNSYSVAYLHSIGVKRVTLSVELLDKDIKDLIDSYYKRYKNNPNLELIKKTKLEVMVIKTDLSKYGNIYYLRDRFNNLYRIIKKNNLFYIYDYKETLRSHDDNYYFNMGINYLRDEFIE